MVNKLLGKSREAQQATAIDLDGCRSTAVLEVDGEDLSHLLDRVIQDLDAHVLPRHVRPEHQLCNHNTDTSPVTFTLAAINQLNRKATVHQKLMYVLSFSEI